MRFSRAPKSDIPGCLLANGVSAAKVPLRIAASTLRFRSGRHLQHSDCCSLNHYDSVEPTEEAAN